MYILQKDKLNEMLKLLSADNEVIVPVKSDKIVEFAVFNNDGSQQIVLDKNADLSPKVLFLPQSEAMYAFKAQKKSLQIAEVAPISTKTRVVFALKHCDVLAVKALDKVFLETQFKDKQYSEKRDKTVIFALACNNSGDVCFCESMGVDRKKAEASVCDVQVYDYADSYGLEFLSEKSQSVKSKISSLLKEENRELPKFSEQKTKLDTKDLPQKLSTMFDDAIWDKYSFKCLECGTCTFVCPTCYCFDINNKIRGDEGVKLRTWDSCMFNEYSLMAGGHNPRPSKKQRVRNRFLHKLEYFYENEQMQLCVGCARCVKKCPMNVDIIKFISEVSSR